MRLCGSNTQKSLTQSPPRYTNMMAKLHADVADDVECDPTAVQHINDQQIEIRIGVCPSKAQARTLRSDIVEMIRSGGHLRIPERGYEDAPGDTLRAVKAKIYRVPWKHRLGGGSPYILHIQDAAHSFAPLSLVPVTMRRLDVKRKLALGYKVAPLWLVLTVTDIRGVWTEAMVRLGSGCPAIDPYDRVIVCDGGRAIIWANGVMAVRDVR